MPKNALSQITKKIHHGAVEYVKDDNKPVSVPPPPVKEKTKKATFAGIKRAKKDSGTKKPQEAAIAVPPNMSDEDIQKLLEAVQEPPDPFLAVSDVFMETWVDSIELPKMTLRSVGQKQQTVKEKSTVLVTLEVTEDSLAQKIHSTVLSNAKKDNVKLDIYWLDPKTVEHENPKILSTWKFLGAKVVAIDFGSAEYERKEKSLVSVEFEFKNINIDGTEI
jgi:hypothetical protein